jgi:hypothetical protein
MKIHTVGAMISDDPYTSQLVARRLLLDGAWDLALDVLDGVHADGVPSLRAQIRVERHWWRLDDPAAAAEAVEALPHGSAQAAFLDGQLAYTRLLFGSNVSGTADEGDTADDDTAVAEAGFRAAAADPALAGWGRFWLGVLHQNVREDDAAARPHFEDALRRCREDGDLLLESYVVRHLSGYEADPLPLLRRSLQLRAALGARPQTAAAQAALAAELAEGPERDVLLETAGATAKELGLTWLLTFLP